MGHDVGKQVLANWLSRSSRRCSTENRTGVDSSSHHGLALPAHLQVKQLGKDHSMNSRVNNREPALSCASGRTMGTASAQGEVDGQC